MEAPEVLQHLAGLPCTQSVEDGHDVIMLSNALRNREVKITCIANSPSVQVLLLDHSTVPPTVHTDMTVDHSFEMAGMLVRDWIEWRGSLQAFPEVAASGRRWLEMDAVEQHILRRLQTSTVTAVVVNGEVHSPALEDILSPLELEMHHRWLEAKRQQDKERLLQEIMSRCPIS